jgi:hypothetical protein
VLGREGRTALMEWRKGECMDWAFVLCVVFMVEASLLSFSMA